MGSRDCHRNRAGLIYGVALLAMTALCGPSASGAKVNFWDSEKRAESQLEHLPPTSDGLIPGRSFDERLNRAQTVLEAAARQDALLEAGHHPVGRPADEASNHLIQATTAPAEFTIPIADDPELDLLGPLPDTTPPAMAWTESSTLRDAENVAVPLPSSAWTGFTCLGGIAAYYLLRKARRALR